MSERANLVSLFREVDRSVVELGEEVAHDVSVVLEPYRSGAAGWFERYRSTVDATFDEGLLPVGQALTQMGTTVEGDIDRAKRVIVAAALARAEPMLFLPPPFDTPGDDVTLLVEALLPAMHPDNQEPEQGFALLRLLGGVDEQGVADLAIKYDWPATLVLAVERNLLEATVARQAAVCCQASWTSVEVEGEDWPAAILETRFSTAEIDLEDLRHYLSPENWPGCCSLWCSMRRLNHGLSPSCYLEHISFACPGPWRLRTCLEFVRKELPQGISLEYQRCHDPAHVSASDGIVRIDEGSIVATQHGAQLQVTSTKRVSFRGPFDAPSFAMWACVLGYGEAAREMAFGCARDKPELPSQGWEPDPPLRRSSAYGAPASGSATFAVDHLTEVGAEGLRSSVQAYKNFVATVSTKGVSSEELVKAAAAVWTEPAIAMLRRCGATLPAARAPHRVRSDPFSAGVPFAPHVRRIHVSEPLVSGFGHRIEVAAFQADPPVLQPGQNEFCIAAETAGRPAGVYEGVVRVVGDEYPGARSGGVPVPVWLQVG